MNTKLCLTLSALLAAFSVGACDPDPDALTGDGTKTPGESGEEGSLAEGLTCTEAPEGRSYANFDGAKLEATRENENVGVNRARVKPFAVMEKEFSRVLGVVPPSLKNAAGSFDVPPTRWFGEPQYAATSIYAASAIAFEGCLAHVKGKPAFAAAPTAESASKECGALMRKAWSRTPSPDELGACVDLATTKLATEKDVARRWAYTCASVMSSSQFLTY
jgi:hypothetical protein